MLRLRSRLARVHIMPKNLQNHGSVARLVARHPGARATTMLVVTAGAKAEEHQLRGPVTAVGVRTTMAITTTTKAMEVPPRCLHGSSRSISLSRSGSSNTIRSRRLQEVKAVTPRTLGTVAMVPPLA